MNDLHAQRELALQAYKAAYRLFSYSKGDSQRKSRAKIVDALADECKYLGIGNLDLFMTDQSQNDYCDHTCCCRTCRSERE